MDKNEFFHRAVLSICGNIEIEKALFSCIKLLTNYMPVDRIFLQAFDYEYGSMRTIAMTTKTECYTLDLLTPLSDNAKNAVKRVDRQKENDIFLFDYPDKIDISREMLNYHGVTASSLLVMILLSIDNRVGSLVIASEGKEKLNKGHFQWLRLLKEPFGIALSNTLKHREIVKLKNLLADDNRYLHQELRRISGDEIIGKKFGLKNVMENVKYVASLDTPVLLLGETGVGKDVIANAIHYSSHRKDGPFVSVNCGAIHESLIDSELFGYEKGAFTGAISQKRGRFERAENGTIFLDEIGELPLQAQTRLLRVLQHKEIERVGGTVTIKLNIRIVAATNRNLAESVKNKQFREDLWFRLNVFPITIPPLRKRKSDIPELVQYFINVKTKEMKLPAIPSIAKDAIDNLTNYDWPGNVRELQNIIERALILCKNKPLSFDQFSTTPSIKEAPEIFEQSDDEIKKLDDIIASYIHKVLIKTDGQIHGSNGAAELLGINPSTLRSRIKKLGIQYSKEK